MLTTYWGNTNFGEKKDLGPPWELSHREGMGYFAIALRDFEAGELICSEKPVTHTPGWHPFTDVQIKRINADVGKLSEDEQQAFFDMANVFPECDPVAGIYMTNSFDMTSSSSSSSSSSSFSTGACGMYLAIARLNHSCQPNAQQTHLPTTKEEVLYATRPIKRGEEICDCYIELRQNTAARQRDLKEYYRFTCSCTACSDLSLSTDDAATATTTGAVVGTDTGTDTDTKDESDSHINSGGAGGDKQVSSVFTSVEAIAPVVNKSSKLTTSQHMGRATTMDDENRVMALRLDKQMMQLAEEEQVQKALNCAFEIIKILEAPTSLGWGERYLPDTYLCVFHFSCSLFREGYDVRKWRNMAEKYAYQAYILNLRLQGPVSPDTCSSLAYVQNIEDFLD